MLWSIHIGFFVKKNSGFLQQRKNWDFSSGFQLKNENLD